MAFVSRGLVLVLGMLSLVQLAGCSADTAQLQVQSVVPLGAAPGAMAGGSAGEPATLALARPAASPLARLPVDEARVARAVSLHQLRRQQPAVPYASAGADLDGDGRAEVIVLLGGQACAPDGCPLLVLAERQDGLRPVSRTEHVAGPVAVAGRGAAGWRDLLVSGPGGGRVSLAHAGGAYPADAAEGQPLAAAPAGEVLIAAGPSPVAAPTLAGPALAPAVMITGADAEEGAAGQ